MFESTLNSRLCTHASLAAIGAYLHQRDLLGPIKEKVKIKQKTLKYTPFDKLCDAFLLLLSGAHRMVEINTKLRADPALWEAFGMVGCAEQSVVQDTLDACTDQNVEEMQQAMERIFRQHSRAYRHNYRKTVATARHRPQWARVWQDSRRCHQGLLSSQRCLWPPARAGACQLVR